MEEDLERSAPERKGIKISHNKCMCMNEREADGTLRLEEVTGFHILYPGRCVCVLK